ncbi:SymE family type I addiction module toxin [Danxiaibacter flavus]|uniref:SymE family type I addiction module toxin n=1 Tax=Danxiaibacter flavus TaxID=3049108 RepID=A0ABV3ZLZ1_9BACT
MRTPKKKKVSKRPEVRSLKIQPDIRFNECSQTTVPVIRLSGVWLDKLGFAPEKRVTVTTMNKLLIIRLDEQQ